MTFPGSVCVQQNQDFNLNYRAFIALKTAQGVSSSQEGVNSQVVNPKSLKEKRENREWAPALIPNSGIG